MKTTPSNGIRLLPIPRDGDVPGLPHPLPDDVAPMIEATRGFYADIGFQPPWISYLSVRGGTLVGGAAFVGAPRDGAVEIAYFTFPDFQGQGNARLAAQALVAIAAAQDPAPILWAKTLPEVGPSTRILETLGFRRTGTVIDHEIGEAWHWTLTP